MDGLYGRHGSGTVASVSADDVSIEVDQDFVATVEVHRPPNN
jgi:hypothetical protein